MSDETDMGEGHEYETIAVDGLAEADPDTEHRIKGAFPNPDVALSPVIPLGFTGGKVVFAMPEGEIRMAEASKVGTMLRTDIYACQSGQAFLGHWRDGDDKFQRELATVWFVRKCREAGLWNDKRPVRGLGVWTGEAGAVVLHKGDAIIVFPPSGRAVVTTIAEAMRVQKGPIYKLRPTAPTPAKAATVADGQWARDELDLWRFEAIGGEGLTGADVVAGWLMPALLGAVAPFRAHVMLDAQAGSGKTTLMHFVAAVFSGLDIEVIDSFTPAGLRNDLAGQARPVLIDEAESSPGGQHGPGPVEQALELLRRMATGAGGTRKQGDIGGGSVTQTAVGAVMLAGTSPPKLGPADATRMVDLRLLPLLDPGAKAGGQGGDPPRPLATDLDLETAREKAASLGPAFLGRALKGAARFKADVSLVKAALGRLHEKPRAADLIAMLAAGRRLLLFDEALDAEGADAEAALWKPLLLQRESFDNVSNPGADCLAHLFNVDSGQHVRDRRATIGQLVERWVNQERDYDETLKAHGIKIWEGQWSGDNVIRTWLLVANQHPALEAVFSRTRWPDWRRTLTHLDALGPEYATRVGKPQWFGVLKARCIAIPLTPWVEKLARRGTGGGAGVPDGVPEENLVW